MISFSKIRGYAKHKFDTIPDQKLTQNFLNALPFWIGALLTGLISVVYARLFALAEFGAEYVFGLHRWYFFIVTPACFVLSWWLVKQFSPFSRGSGIPQVTAAIELTNPRHGHLVNKLLSLRVILVKVLSSLAMVFGGGAIGREGPTIQISASIFKKINDLLPAWYPKVSRRNMIVTGAAAGLASAFNTPLGGIVFTIEELTKTHFSFFKSALLTGVIIAGLTALTLLGPYLYLGYPQTNNTSAWIILAIIPTALICGIGGSGMGSVILWVFLRKKALKKTLHIVLYLIACGLALALLANITGPNVLGSGKQIIQSTLFTGNKVLPWYTPVLRFIGPVLSFSTGGAGGIFAPSLSAGASVGAVLGHWFKLSNTETNLLILCGMTGFLTGITRSPFTSSILVIEMTNDHSIIFYLMLTALMANLISNYVSRHSFYDHLKEQYIHEVHQQETGELTKTNAQPLPPPQAKEDTDN